MLSRQIFAVKVFGGFDESVKKMKICGELLFSENDGLGSKKL